MSKTIGTDDIRPGQVVRFVYSGGSTPGTARMVFVRKSDDKHIEGDDLGNDPSDCYRKFLRTKVHGGVGLIAAENEEVIPASDFLKMDARRLTPQTIVGIYQLLHPNRKSVRYEDDGLIVARRDDLPRFELVVGKDQTTFEFLNEDGRRFGMEFNYPIQGDSFSLPHQMSGRLDGDTMRKFADQLAKHVRPQPPTANAAWSDYVADRVAKGDPFYADK